MGLQGVIGHADLQLVGLYVERTERAGRDAGELCDRPRTGIRATNSVQEILALQPDCLAYFGSGAIDVPAAIEKLVPILESGCDVVTTSLGNLIHSHYAPKEQLERLQSACRKGGSSFFATGIEPGYASDLLPASLLGIVDELQQLRIQEIADYSRYGVASVMRGFFGFGQPPEYAVPLFSGTRLRDTWGGVVHYMAEEVGVHLQEVREVKEVAITARDIDTAFGVVKAGTIGGVRFEVQGIVNDFPVLIVEHINFLAADVAPHWRRGQTGKDTVYRIAITGRPTLTCELALDCIAGEEHGLIGTAMRAINAIPIVHAAAPGIVGPRDIPARASRHVATPQRP
jgi:4-hydroxy-tetrahydrodipicolinate reductase